VLTAERKGAREQAGAIALMGDGHALQLLGPVGIQLPLHDDLIDVGQYTPPPVLAWDRPAEKFVNESLIHQDQHHKTLRVSIAEEQGQGHHPFG
jgi:hypothetical protein